MNDFENKEIFWQITGVKINAYNYMNDMLVNVK